MVNVTARLDEKAITQIFALENPLRLVVDFFHTLYPDPTFRYPLGKLDIQRVRTGQFETAPPYTIARLVFDLDRPKFYTLFSEKETFIFQFYKDEMARVAPAMAPPSHFIFIELKDTPSTIVLEFDNAETAEDFQISRGESLLVEDIRVEKIEDNDIHVLIDLKEQVPYRIYAEQEQTIVELNRIQRTLNGYIIDSATEEELKKWPKKQLLFKEVGIFEEKDMVNVTAKLDEKAITQIFALENPPIFPNPFCVLSVCFIKRICS